MKTIFIILGVLAGIIVLALIIALFTKKEYAVERTVTINKPVNEVYDYLKHLKNQTQYNKFTMKDPNMQSSFTGTDGEVGFVYHWSGNKEAGEGDQEIKRLVENKEIETELRFIRPFSGVGQAYFTTVPSGNNQTTVSWKMQSKMAYPMNLILLVVNMEKGLGTPIGESLGLLKQQLESK
ncbi:polyketide cyclase/dehydrase/lipid transport protein [Chitinophaga skermanii]|uniref:Polyketide cyclase/dehydrase/lipid transport protein n=1 Tax=Chitinophaga skermanii TaxID=331697 RepID=A0A327QWW8_9BACT|nr:SRPBCC family protein [Chitinophaga skermanii]RAJ08821.1 polyketide cyclase/dehydrase/lipid transport protein [Chitinophaga skermanii]